MKRFWRMLIILTVGAFLTLGLVVTSTEATPAPASPDIPFLRPDGIEKGVVLLLSDSNGITETERSIAAALTHQGLITALISSPQLLQQAEASPKSCLNLNYGLIQISRDVQHRAKLHAYRQPAIVGIGEGGTIAYASLAQWPHASYAGMVSVDPLSSIRTTKPWCRGPGFSAFHQEGSAAWSFQPNPEITVRWTTISSSGAVIAEVVARQTAGLLPHSRALPRAVRLMLPDMPLTLIPARQVGKNADMLAIIYSGDGGWVGIDRDLAQQLANAGIPVVGVDSLSYFWVARTPQGAGKDLKRLMSFFTHQWHRPKLLLIGYSFGADALPHMVATLDPSSRRAITQMSLLGLSPYADFQFHLANWLNISSDNALPTLPAINRLRGLPIQCVRGMAERDSACVQIGPGIVHQFRIPGDHHFNRNAPLLAAIILGTKNFGLLDTCQPLSRCINDRRLAPSYSSQGRTLQPQTALSQVPYVRRTGRQTEVAQMPGNHQQQMRVDWPTRPADL